MPYPQDMVYVRFEFGWQPSGAAQDLDIQDFGLWGTLDVTTGVTFDWQEVTDAIAKQCTGAWASTWATSQFSGAVKARRVVAYHYDQTHKNVLHRGEAGFSPDHTWAGSGDVLPPQMCLAVSTYSWDPSKYQADARSHRGRYYLPTLATGMVNSSGWLTDGNQSSFLEQAEDFHNSMTAALIGTNPTIPPAIYWRPYVSSPTKQYANKITHLRVGRLLDVQRRRGNALSENYQAGPVNN